MTPDELRALAEKLFVAMSFHDPDSGARKALIETVAYLRAQADAQPVAKIERVAAGAIALFAPDGGPFNMSQYVGVALYAHAAPAVPAGWKLVPVEPTREMIFAAQQYHEGEAYLPFSLYKAMLAAAPAVPQAEPADRCRSSETPDPKATGRSSPEQPASNREDAAAMVAAGSGEQAEPTGPHMIVAEDRFPDVPAERWKPCPQCGEDVDRECPICDGLGRVLATDSEQAEPKREPLSDERITKGEYVLATKWSDGDPGDHWGVGFYDRFANGRHYVVDSAGKQIRGNGFRRVGRITVEVGRWLLSAAKSLEASPPGTVNLWTMLTERAHGIGGSDER